MRLIDPDDINALKTAKALKTGTKRFKKLGKLSEESLAGIQKAYGEQDSSQFPYQQMTVNYGFGSVDIGQPKQAYEAYEHMTFMAGVKQGMENKPERDLSPKALWQEVQTLVKDPFSPFGSARDVISDNVGKLPDLYQQGKEIGRYMITTPEGRKLGLQIGAEMFAPNPVAYTETFKENWSKLKEAKSFEEKVRYFGNMTVAGLSTAMMTGGASIGTYGSWQTKDKSKLVGLKKAKQMSAVRASKSKIFKETGWFKDPKGNWRYEIKDYGQPLGELPDGPEPNSMSAMMAQLGIPVPRSPAPDGDPLGPHIPLTKVLPNHKELFKAYPNLAKNEVYDLSFRQPIGTTGGSGYRKDTGKPVIMINKAHIVMNQESMKRRLKLPPDTPIDDLIKETLFHEIQHQIDALEGMPTGGGVQEFAQKPILKPGKNPALKKYRQDYFKYLADRDKGRLLRKLKNDPDYRRERDRLYDIRRLRNAALSRLDNIEDKMGMSRGEILAGKLSDKNLARDSYMRYRAINRMKTEEGKKLISEYRSLYKKYQHRQKLAAHYEHQLKGRENVIARFDQQIHGKPEFPKEALEDPFKSYYRLMGEVTARDVGYRSMDPRQQGKLPYSTYRKPFDDILVKPQPPQVRRATKALGYKPYEEHVNIDWGDVLTPTEQVEMKFKGSLPMKGAKTKAYARFLNNKRPRPKAAEVVPPKDWVDNPKQGTLSYNLDDVIAKFGPADDVKQAGFILKDGRMVRKFAPHSNIAVRGGYGGKPYTVNPGQPFQVDTPSMKAMKAEGAIRVNYSAPRKTQYIEMLDTTPTPQQFKQMFMHPKSEYIVDYVWTKADGSLDYEIFKGNHRETQAFVKRMMELHGDKPKSFKPFKQRDYSYSMERP